MIDLCALILSDIHGNLPALQAVLAAGLPRRLAERLSHGW